MARVHLEIGSSPVLVIMRPGPRCKVCFHPQRIDIEREILGNLISFNGAAQKYALSKGTLVRHFHHKQTIAHGTARERLHVVAMAAQSTLDAIASRPNASDFARIEATKAALSATSKYARMTGELTLDPKKCLRAAFESPEFKSFVGELIAALQPIPGAFDAARPALDAFEKAVVT